MEKKNHLESWTKEASTPVGSNSEGLTMHRKHGVGLLGPFTPNPSRWLGSGIILGSWDIFLVHLGERTAEGFQAMTHVVTSASHDATREESIGLGSLLHEHLDAQGPLKGSQPLLFLFNFVPGNWLTWQCWILDARLPRSSQREFAVCLGLESLGHLWWVNEQIDSCPAKLHAVLKWQTCVCF